MAVPLRRRNRSIGQLKLPHRRPREPKSCPNDRKKRAALSQGVNMGDVLLGFRRIGCDLHVSLGIFFYSVGNATLAGDLDGTWGV